MSDDSGKIPDVIRVDGEVFFLFTESRAKETAKRLKNYSLIEEELSLSRQSIELHKNLVETTEQICEASERMLELERESFKRLADTIEKAPDPSWYESPSAVFLFGSFAGILTASVLFWIGSK